MIRAVAKRQTDGSVAVLSTAPGIARAFFFRLDQRRRFSGERLARLVRDELRSRLSARDRDRYAVDVLVLEAA